MTRTPPKAMAKKLADIFKDQNPDYEYMKAVFRHLREILGVTIERKPKRLPLVPTEAELKMYYKAVWQAKNSQDMIIIKVFLYTGVRVAELVVIRLADIDFDSHQIRINRGKGQKDRIVPFPKTYAEILAMHVQAMKKKGAQFLFESSWKRQYTDRGVRKILTKYAKAAGLDHNISPHQLRHFLLTWLKKQGIDDAFIQSYSGHESRKSLEIYSRLALSDGAQEKYDEAIDKFPI